jgi:hypothetical protein
LVAACRAAVKFLTFAFGCSYARCVAKVFDLSALISSKSALSALRFLFLVAARLRCVAKVLVFSVNQLNQRHQW